MRCPHCGSTNLQVIDSREAPEAVRRRRECEHGHRFTTYERHEAFVCPRCGAAESRLEQVEPTARGVQRRRRCAECGLNYVTVERFERSDLSVVKSDGRREPFNRDKLFQSLRSACAKRPVPVERIQVAVDDIETALFDSNRAEIESGEIATMVVERLISLDEVAYVRYASGYLEAGGIDGLLDVIREALRRRELESIRRTHIPLVPDEREPPG